MNKILSPATPGQGCRNTIATGSKLGTLTVRIGLAASVAYGNDWFPINDVSRSLVSSKEGNTTMAGVLAQRLVQLGIAETRLQNSGRGFHINVARLTCDLVEQSHFHGQKSL